MSVMSFFALVRLTSVSEIVWKVSLPIVNFSAIIVAVVSKSAKNNVMRFIWYVLIETAKLIVFIYLCKYFLKIRLIFSDRTLRCGTGRALQAKGEEKPTPSPCPKGRGVFRRRGEKEKRRRGKENATKSVA
jgi:hypothetical protein